MQAIKAKLWLSAKKDEEGGKEGRKYELIEPILTSAKLSVAFFTDFCSTKHDPKNGVFNIKVWT